VRVSLHRGLKRLEVPVRSCRRQARFRRHLLEVTRALAASEKLTRRGKQPLSICDAVAPLRNRSRPLERTRVIMCTSICRNHVATQLSPK
jgi:hypothetical protein